MRAVFGSPGTWIGLLLRSGQCAFASASIGVMLSASGFSNYTAFCYLVASMGLQATWSLGLSFIDMHALKVKRDIRNPLLISLFVIGDWVTAILSLAAACSSAGVAILFVRDVGFCRAYPQLSCVRYQISVAMAFITWFLVAISSLAMFWILASF